MFILLFRFQFFMLLSCESFLSWFFDLFKSIGMILSVLLEFCGGRRQGGLVRLRL